MFPRKQFPGTGRTEYPGSQLMKSDLGVLVIAQVAFYVCEHDFGRTLTDARASSQELRVWFSGWVVVTARLNQRFCLNDNHATHNYKSSRS
jgi:hypothetical protein